MRLGYADEKVRKHLQILGSNISNANRIMVDLVDFILVNKPALRKSDIKAIVGEALSQPSLPDHWQAVVHLDDSLAPLMADAIRLQGAGLLQFEKQGQKRAETRWLQARSLMITSAVSGFHESFTENSR